MGKTITEKIFAAHLRDEPFEGTYVLSLDVVMCHEITTPIAIADLQWRGKDRVFDPSKIKAVIDHVTPAKDSKSALQGKIMRDWAARHGIRDFFDIGRNGVCHALFPEKGFIRPGYTVIMGDSHTCTHGAFGAFAAGVGTTDLEVGILKGVCAFRQPKSVRVDLSGTMRRGVYAKDVILTIIKELTVNGATDQVIEFRGPAVDAMSMEERMTLSNMAIEAGGTSGLCLPDATTVEYLWPFIAGEYESRSAVVEAYKKWHSDPDAVYTKTIAIDVGRIEPSATFGFKPDQVKPLRGDARCKDRSGLYRQLHQRPHQRSARRGCNRQRNGYRSGCARHCVAGDSGSICAGDGGRIAQNLPGCRLLHLESRRVEPVSACPPACWRKVKCALPPPIAISTAGWAKAAWCT